MSVLLSLSLWLAVMMMSSCGSAGSHEEQTTTEVYDYQTETVTPDYDYTATFDYIFVTGHYLPEENNQAAGIGPFSLVLLLGLAVSQMWN